MELLKAVTLQSWHEDFGFALRQLGGSQDIDLLPPKLEDYLSVRYESGSLQQDVLDRLKYALLWFWGHQELLESEGLTGSSPTPPKRYVADALIFALGDATAYFPLGIRGSLLSLDPRMVVNSAKGYLDQDYHQ